VLTISFAFSNVEKTKMSRWSCRCPFLLLIVASFILVNQPQPTDAAAIPIWELLKHEEKVTIDANSISCIKVSCHEIDTMKRKIIQNLNSNFTLTDGPVILRFRSPSGTVLQDF
jgi:hypothetical protein